MGKSTVDRTKGKLLVMAAVLAVGMMFAGTAFAEGVRCSDFGGVVETYLKADLVADVGCTVGPAGFVHGNIYARGGKVRIQGGVNGNISQKGRGGVIVEEGADINGNIEETGPGGVWVRVGAGKVFNGDITEQGPGVVKVAVMEGGLFNGNIEKKGKGDLTTEGGGTFNGSTRKEGPGRCRNAVADFKGAACK